MSGILLYRVATSVAQMDASHVPAVVQAYCTQAIQDHYAHWTAKESSAPPAMAYRHWADLIRSVVYGPACSLNKARLSDPMDYRTLTYLRYYAACHMAGWVEDAKRLDPIKGYKLARKLAKPILEEEAAKFRLSVRLIEDDFLDVIAPLLKGPDAEAA